MGTIATTSAHYRQLLSVVFQSLSKKVHGDCIFSLYIVPLSGLNIGHRTTQRPPANGVLGVTQGWRGGVRGSGRLGRSRLLRGSPRRFFDNRICISLPQSGATVAAQERGKREGKAPIRDRNVKPSGGGNVHGGGTDSAPRNKP